MEQTRHRTSDPAPSTTLPPLRRLRGVLLDVDGTLIDSNDAHASAWLHALREHGFEVPFEWIRPLMGMGGDKLLPAVSGIAADSPAGKSIGRRRQQIFLDRYLPALEPFPGTRALLEYFLAHNLRLCVASSAQPDELRPLLERAGVADLIEETATAGDAERSKPDPDIIQAALDRAGLAPAQAIMIGDTRFDVDAAARAGVAVIALRCGGSDEVALHGATAIYDDPAQLLFHYHAVARADGSGK